MYPHERSLVEKLADEPFALLGVNSDENRDDLKQIVAQERLTWRSWWDGGIDGPIHRQWNVTARPAVFLIDAEGVVRYKNIFGSELDRAIEELIAEAKAR